MADETANGAAENTGPVFSIEKIYAKDVSFEVPGAPAVFNEQAQPQHSIGAGRAYMCVPFPFLATVNHALQI